MPISILAILPGASFRAPDPYRFGRILRTRLPGRSRRPRRSRRSRRDWLWLTAAAIGLNLGMAAPTLATPIEGVLGSDPAAACYVADTFTVVCAGDWSQGLIIDNDTNGTEYRVLDLHNDALPTDPDTGRPTVTPASGVSAISVLNHGDFALTTREEDAFDIKTQGDEAHGFWFDSFAEHVDVTFSHHGDITTDGEGAHGIHFFQTGSAGTPNRVYDIRHTGNIVTLGSGDSSGVYMQLEFATVTLLRTGDFYTESAGSAIYIDVSNATGPIVVTNIGDIVLNPDGTADGYGIDVRNSDQSVVVTQIGDMEVNGITAILAEGLGSGSSVRATVVGNIKYWNDGSGSEDHVVFLSANAGADFNFTGILDAEFQVASDVSKPTIQVNSSSGRATSRTIGKLEVIGVVSGVMLRDIAPVIRANASGSGDVLVEHLGAILADPREGHAAGIQVSGVGDLTVNLGRVQRVDENGDPIDGEYVSETLINGSLGQEDYLATGATIIAQEFGILLEGETDQIATVNLYGDVLIYTTPSGGGVDESGVPIELINPVDLKGGDQNDIINIFGTFTSMGIIDLGTGDNEINNEVGGVFHTGELIVLGPDGVFINRGDISPGGPEEQVMFAARYEADGTTEIHGDIILPGIRETVISGNFTMESGTYTVTVNDDGESDLLSIESGTVTLNGGTVRALPRDGYDFDDPYLILQSERPIVGTFAGVQQTAFVRHRLDYDTIPDSILLHVERAAGPCDIATNANQSAIGCNIIQPLFDDVDTLSTQDAFAQSILQLETAEEVRNAYDALSGDAHASLPGALMSALQAQQVQLLQRLSNIGSSSGGGGVTFGLSHGPASHPWAGANWWTAAHGSYLDHDGGGGTAGGGTAGGGGGGASLTSESSGFLIGFDHTRDSVTLGLAVGSSVTDTDIDDRLSSSDTDTWTLASYGSYTTGALRVSFGSSADWHEVDSSRSVVFGSFAQHLSAAYDATSWQGFVDVEYDIAPELSAGAARVEIDNVDLSWMDRLSLRPFARLAHTWLESDGFTETGTAPSTFNAALTVDKSTTELTSTTIGLRSGLEISGFRFDSSIGWRRAYGDLEPTSQVSLAGSSPFSVTGTQIDEDALVAEFAASTRLHEGLYLTSTVGGEVSDNSHAYGVKLELTGHF